MPVVYSNDGVVISTGVNMRDEVMVSDGHARRDLSNSIKISVNSENARFIQFVTRLVPDLYAAFSSAGKTQKWDVELSGIEPHYMTDGGNPRWKVDVTPDSETCYYDEQGAHKRDGGFSVMYDCPGGVFEPKEERAVFCTFVVIDNCVTHKVRWSRQHDIHEEPFYSVDVQRCERLPDWAIRNITTNCSNTNKKIFLLPERLLALQNLTVTDTELDDSTRGDFLLPPLNWITRRDFPDLFREEALQYTHQPTH